jgi:hypothetical protein
MLKPLIERKLEMDKSDLKKNFLAFVAYLEQMTIIHVIHIIHDEHCHVVEHTKTGDSVMRNAGKVSNAGGRISEHHPGEKSLRGGSNKTSDRGRTSFDHGRLSDSSGTEKPSTREPPSCLNTTNYAGINYYLSVYPHTSKDKATFMLAEYKKRRDDDKNMANLKSLGRNGAMAENRDGQTAYLTAENLGVKVTVLVNTGSGHSSVPRSAVENARKPGFPLKVELLPSPSC